MFSSHFDHAMKRFLRLRTISLYAIFLCLLTAGLPAAYSADQDFLDTAGQSAANDAPPALLSPYRTNPRSDATANAAAGFARDPEVVRAQQVAVDWRGLSAMFDVPNGSLQTHAITLNLFNDVSFIADMVQVSRQAEGGTWTGALRGVELGQIILVVSGDVVSANISMPEARYHIRYTGNGIHEVQKIDSSLFPEDERSVPVPGSDAARDTSEQPTVGAQADDGSIIDVMVAYTALARAAAGGTAAIQSQINLAIAETNQSYQNSGVIQRVRLVHAVEVSYPETGADPLGAALNCITNTADGCLDNIPTLRNTYGADLVSFWMENGGDFCGLGWFMQSVSASFASRGYSTVRRSCATGNYSFGHEMGHNMGMMHDVFVESGTLPYPYAHGYTAPSATNPWRTIMAYNNACAAVNKTCTRIQYWSNPTQTFSGVAMGNVSTADDHRALNNTASVVANFRQSSSCIASVVTTPLSLSAAAATITATITIGPACAWTVASNVGWAVSAAGATRVGNGSVTFSVAANTTMASRAGTLVIAGQPFELTQAFEDGFPQGSSLPAGWTQSPGSTAPWAVNSSAAFGGGASIRSGTITHLQNSAIQVRGNYKAGTVSFAVKVGSESGYDYLSFYIDNVKQASWAGNVNWTYVSYPVAAGAHTFKWAYEKDNVISTAPDAAWIDDVTLPPLKAKSTVAGNLLLLLD
ncbi:MAG: M12 family metallo-peptidase [Pseudomonadota bacterium]